MQRNQSGFARNLVERFNMQDRYPSRTPTPYRSKSLIDTIAAADASDDSPAQKRGKRGNYSLVLSYDAP